MGLFGARNHDTQPAKSTAPVVFEPQPLEDSDPGESTATDSPVFGAFDFYAAPATAASGKPAAKKGAAKKGAAKQPRPKAVAYEVKPPGPGLSDSERRAALRTQMADLARAYKDAPLEEIETAIKKTLVAHGQEVPEEWVTTIAEGLRRNGPTPINYDGVDIRSGTPS
jgi:hypothetical protein